MNLFFDTSALVKFFHEEDWAFVATDESLCGVAKLIGYNTINPLMGNA